VAMRARPNKAPRPIPTFASGKAGPEGTDDVEEVVWR
jgi:hypothetical protein